MDPFEMSLNEYQEKASKTDLSPGTLTPPWLYYVLGLAGEAGEVANKVKKVFRDNNGIATKKFVEEVAGELGDVLWYLATLAGVLGMSLNEVAEMNLDKLASRYDAGTIHGDGDAR